MFLIDVNQQPAYSGLMRPATRRPSPQEVQAKSELDDLLAELSPDISWGDRRKAAKKLGYTRSRQALPGLLAALPDDPFWMVRVAIIQALEMIGDPAAIPTLSQVAEGDGFLTVRSHAATTIKRLSKAGGTN